MTNANVEKLVDAITAKIAAASGDFVSLLDCTEDVDLRACAAELVATIFPAGPTACIVADHGANGLHGAKPVTDMFALMTLSDAAEIYAIELARDAARGDQYADRIAALVQDHFANVQAIAVIDTQDQGSVLGLRYRADAGNLLAADMQSAGCADALDRLCAKILNDLREGRRVIESADRTTIIIRAPQRHYSDEY